MSTANARSTHMFHQDNSAAMGIGHLDGPADLVRELARRRANEGEQTEMVLITIRKKEDE
ncbi:uncharacterized protein PG986_003833 [Apiospora aurea]|uniref:Uncharacterized protein n=1 Tax=Apiospora aurea TaxID=335848 RepID=A0ABR1QKV6_9PEZI